MSHRSLLRVRRCTALATVLVAPPLSMARIKQNRLFAIAGRPCLSEQLQGFAPIYESPRVTVLFNSGHSTKGQNTLRY